MKEEMELLEKNETWKLCQLSNGRTTIECKWVHKAKEDILYTERNIRLKAWLVAQSFTQR